MNDYLQEMAARAQAQKLSGLFEVTRAVALTESIPYSEAWRTTPKQLPKFLDGCMMDAKVTSAEAFVLGSDLGAVALKNPMLIPDADLGELKKWFSFYGRAFRLRQYADEPHPQTTLEKELRQLITEVAEFVAGRLRAHGVKKPF